MFESIHDYDQRIALAQKLLQQAKEKNLSAQEKFEYAQDVASLAAPGWEWIIRKWEPAPKWGKQVPKVHGRQIEFDTKISVEELAAVIIHKTDHMVMGHQDRQGHRDDKLWNVASCLEDIKRWQEVFEKLGVALPKKIDPSQTIKDLPRAEAEDLYDIIDPSLAQEAGSDGDQEQEGEGQQQQQGGKGKQQPGQDPNGQGQSRRGQGQGQDDTGDPGDGEGQGQEGEGQGQGQPGDAQGQGGKGQGQPRKPTQDEIDNAADCELTEDDFDQSMLDPADGLGQPGDGDGLEGDGEGDGDGDGDGDGKGNPDGKPGKPGNETGDNRREVDPRQPYLSLIRLIRKRLNLGNNRKNYTLRRPSNRSEQTNGGVLSRLDQTPDALRIVVDSSGSLNRELLSSIFRAVADLERAARRDGAVNRTVYAHGDTALKAVGGAHKMETVIAGGGTDMKKVFEAAMLHPKMRNGTAWVLITDGETPTWPARVPRNTVVVLVNRTLRTGQPVPDRVNWGAPIPDHIRRNAICISEKDFVEGAKVGRIQRGGRGLAA